MFSSSRRRLSEARSRNNIGWMLVRLGRPDAARPHLVRAIAIFEELGVETRKGDIIHSLAELALAENDLSEAVRLAGEAIALGTRLGELPTVASSHALLGRIAARQGRHSDADLEFAAALEAAEAGGGPRLMEVHEMYAEVLETRGDLASANQHLRQAIAAYRPPTPLALESRIAIA